MGTAKQVNVLR